MSDRSRLTVTFSCLGHLYIHLFVAFYFVIVLALEDAWRLPYHDLIRLWTVGSLMVGAIALPAGMIADRVGSATMMVVFFVGMGFSAVMAGMASSPTSLFVALTAIGVFAAIYHPVGIPWLVRNAGPDRGKALGFNGVFGSLGSAGAGITAGVLIDSVSWRAAFIVPGAVCTVTGIALLFFLLRGAVPDGAREGGDGAEPHRRDMVRAFGILVVTMFLAGLVYHSIQTALPKLFEQRHGGLVGEGTTGIGLLVAAVYTVAGIMQVLGGHLADRFPLKPVYAGAILIQIPALWLAATLGGLPLVVVATIMVMAGAGALPAENMLLARYTPERRHGLAFGLKFALSFGAAPIAVQLVAYLTGRTGGFYWVFVTLTALTASAMVAAIMLPSAKSSGGLQPSPIAPGTVTGHRP